MTQDWESSGATG